jgi:hypothetical protein
MQQQIAGRFAIRRSDSSKQSKAAAVAAAAEAAEAASSGDRLPQAGMA